MGQAEAGQKKKTLNPSEGIGCWRVNERHQYPQKKNRFLCHESFFSMYFCFLSALQSYSLAMFRGCSHRRLGHAGSVTLIQRNKEGTYPVLNFRTIESTTSLPQPTSWLPMVIDCRTVPAASHRCCSIRSNRPLPGNELLGCNPFQHYHWHDLSWRHDAHTCYPSPSFRMIASLYPLSIVEQPLLLKWHLT